MADWSLLNREWLPVPPPAPFDPYQYADYDPYYQEKAQQLPPPPAQQPQSFYSPPAPSPTLALLLSSPRHQDSLPTQMPLPLPMPMSYMPPIPRGDNPREMRNKAEKQRRDKLNQSIAELASMVPPVVAASRKIDKTGVLRLTAHYLRAHQYVFGDSISHSSEFTSSSTRALLGFLNGFLLTTTYKGLIVVVSQNVNEYLGYTELDLLGQNLFNLTHEDDRQMLKDQLMPRTQTLGPNGELIVPEDGEGRKRVAQALANEKRRFIVRFKKLGQRSEPCKYVTCHVEGSLRKSDRACRGYNRCCQMVRRARARGDNPCSSGNDVVFIGVVRPTTETFINESAMESYKMEYRTRHSIDGEIIQCEQRISLVTGYMTHEVNGVNAMNFIHRDEVRWVIVALREMYDQNLLYGESCYRLMTKNGQLIYMRTRGRLDVDKDSRAVTSFICTNTVVDEDEGKQLIKMMKDRFTLSDNNNESTPTIQDSNASDQSVPVEDPRQLEEVILQLVTNLPSPASTADNPPSFSPNHGEYPSRRLAIIPPKKERIVSAIEKIYTVIKTIPKQPSILQDEAFALFPNSNNILNAQDMQNQAAYFGGTDANSDVNCSPGTSSDFDYGGGDNNYLMPRAYSDAKMKSQLVNLQEYANQCLLSDPVMPGLSSGMKRTKNYDKEEGISTKKKITEIINENPEDVSLNSPSLELFFDEAILNTQIESAFDTLEQTIDPSFPDLLISKEVQDILGTMEEPEEELGI